MSTTLNIGDIVEVRHWITLSDQAAVNVGHWQLSSISFGVLTDSDVATSFVTLCAPLYKALICNDAQYRGAVVQRIWPLPKPVSVSSSSPGFGTAGAVALAKQTAGIVSFYTNLAGAGGRGRAYIPFPAVADNITDGFPSSSYQFRLTPLKNALGTADAIVGVGGSGTLTPGIWHRSPPAAANTFTPFQATYTRTAWATQRRRGTYGRQNVSPL